MGKRTDVTDRARKFLMLRTMSELKEVHNQTEQQDEIAKHSTRIQKKQKALEKRYQAQNANVATAEPIFDEDNTFTFNCGKSTSISIDSDQVNENNIQSNTV